MKKYFIGVLAFVIILIDLYVVSQIGQFVSAKSDIQVMLGLALLIVIVTVNLLIFKRLKIK